MDFRQFIETEFRFEGKSVGIVTGHNPEGKRTTTSKNKQFNKELWNHLRADGYDPWAIKGHYKGTEEQSFLVPDISRSDLVRFGKRFKQEAVVWAKKTAHGYEVEWIEDSKTTKKSHVTNIRSLISQSAAF